MCICLHKMMVETEQQQFIVHSFLTPTSLRGFMWENYMARFYQVSVTLCVQQSFVL